PSADLRGFDLGSQSAMIMGGADSCDDGDPCSTDACAPATTGADAQGCVHTAVVCNAADQCHAAGVCDPATGAWSRRMKLDRVPCDDGDACTQTDTCQAGTWTGSTPVVCSAADQCHAAGVPDPALCPSGGAVSCDGGAPCASDACAPATTGEAAQGCVRTAVVCNAADQCHAAGVCDPA